MPQASSPAPTGRSPREVAGKVQQGGGSRPVSESIQVLVHVKCDPHETQPPEGAFELVSSIGPDKIECTSTLRGVGTKQTTQRVTAEQLRAQIEAAGSELTPPNLGAGTDATVWFQLMCVDNRGTILESSEKKILQDAGSHMRLTGTHPVEWAVELHGLNKETLRKCYDTDGWGVRCKVGHENDGQDNISSAWQLSELIVTYIQHDPAEQTGEHAVLSHASTNNIQWNFLPPDKKHWIGHVMNTCRCTKYKIEAKKMQIEMLQQQIAELEDEVEALQQQDSVEQFRWTDPDMCEPRCRALRPLSERQLGECPHCQLEIECRKFPASSDAPKDDCKERAWKIGAAAVLFLILLILIIALA
jgi:hypothetical protein